jgi:hypothetical protein
MLHIKFLINSNIKNKDIVLPKLIDSFILNKIVPENILVVFGGCDKIFFQKNNHYSILGVTHNSIDFTALIAVIEHVYSLIDNNFSIPDYWFYLHDTCELGASFHSFLENYIFTLDSNVNTIPLTYYKSMNIGLYKYTFLLNHKNKIFELRSYNHPSIEQIEYFKNIGVMKEDFIFYLDKNNIMYTNNINIFNISFTQHNNKDRLLLHNALPSIIYENSKILRITEYFSSLDFYKYKANWELKEKYTLDP